MNSNDLNNMNDNNMNNMNDMNNMNSMNNMNDMNNMNNMSNMNNMNDMNNMNSMNNMNNINNANTMNGINENKKKLDKNKIILIAIVAVVVIILVVFVVVNIPKNNKNNNDPVGGDNTDTTQKELEKLEENITNEAYVAQNGRLVVIAKNNNDIPLTLKIEVEFYDEAGKILGTGEETLNGVGANVEIAKEITQSPESYNNYKVYIDVKKLLDAPGIKDISYYDQIELTHNDTGEEIIVQAKNNSNDTIEYVSVAVVYYANGKVVGCKEGLEMDVKSGRSANFTLNYPYDKNYNDIKFDDYKIYLNEAYGTTYSELSE